MPPKASIFDSLPTSFWDGYSNGRPRPSTSFFERIFAYHASHGGDFGLVNDVGAGSGQWSLVLAQRFAKVAVTEPAGASLDVARQRLTQGEEAAARKFSFHEAGAEDATVQGPGSVDMVFACVMMHWTDVPVAIATFYQQLKPGGTLLMCLFGMARFFDPAIQRLWGRIMSTAINHRHDSLPGEMRRRANRDLNMQDTGYDAIELPESMFRAEATQRIKINFYGDDRNAQRLGPECDTGLEYVSRIRPGEQVIREDDVEEWFLEKNLDGLREYHYLLLWFPLNILYGLPFLFHTYPMGCPESAVEADFKELEAKLDGGTCKGYWPVSIILATKT